MTRGAHYLRLTAQVTLVLASYDMDLANRDVYFQAPRRSSFSIKNILNLQDERALTAFPRVSGEEIEDAKVSIIRPIVTPITYAMNPPPLMRYPYAGLGSPLSGISLNWSADPTAQANFPTWICNTSFMQSYEHFHGKCKVTASC